MNGRPLELLEPEMLRTKVNFQKTFGVNLDNFNGFMHLMEIVNCPWMGFKAAVPDVQRLESRKIHKWLELTM